MLRFDFRFSIAVNISILAQSKSLDFICAKIRKKISEDAIQAVRKINKLLTKNHF